MRIKAAVSFLLLMGLLYFLLKPVPQTFQHNPTPKLTLELEPKTQSQLLVPIPRGSTAPSKIEAKHRVASPMSQPRSENRYAKKPDGNVIEFNVVNGWAVAYGDVLLGKPQEGSQITQGRYDAPTPRTWDKPEIPYVINPTLPNPQRVETALDYFRQNTPVRFIPYTGQKDAISFETGQDNCYSFIGKTGGVQPIHLSPNCQAPQIMHEIMHVLGFVHEQSRPDRDQYIEVLWDHIQENYKSEYAIVPESFFDAERATPFDFRSIMMYSPQGFAIQPDLPTMRPLGSTSIAPVQEGLSEEDIRKIRSLFRL
jgi:hypothetical protein